MNRIDTAADLAAGLHPLLRQDGELRARQGPLVVCRRFAEVISRLKERVADEPAGRLLPVVQVPDGLATLDEYLATRVVELVVHTDDIATTIGIPQPDLPETATAVTIELLV